MLADKHFLIVLFAYQLQSGLKEFISAFVINFNCKTFFGFSSGLDESQNTSTAESPDVSGKRRKTTTFNKTKN